jgi:hypothetical protein
MKELKLLKISGFAVYSSDTETNGSIKGYYTNHDIATVASKGSGFWGKMEQ